MRNRWLLVAAFGILAVSARAVVWDRNDGDFVNEILDQSREQAASMPSAMITSAVVAGSKLRLQGQLIGDDPLSQYSDSDPLLSVQLFLVLNGDRDRVAIKAGLDGYTSSEGRAAKRRHLSRAYVFPQLRYDAKTRQVLLGETVIAQDLGFPEGLQFVDGYEAQWSIGSRRINDGFERSSERVLEVSIVQK